MGGILFTFTVCQPGTCGAPLGLEVAPDEFRFLPTTRTEGACASSSVALYNAAWAIESGRFKKVLVIGVEKMTLLTTRDTTHTLACSSYWPEEGSRGMTFPGLFAEYAKGYMAHYRIHSGGSAKDAGCRFGTGVQKRCRKSAGPFREKQPPRASRSVQPRKRSWLCLKRVRAQIRLSPIH